jgi:hypothetical protein
VTFHGVSLANYNVPRGREAEYCPIQKSVN